MPIDAAFPPFGFTWAQMAQWWVIFSTFSSKWGTEYLSLISFFSFVDPKWVLWWIGDRRDGPRVLGSMGHPNPIILCFGRPQLLSPFSFTGIVSVFRQIGFMQECEDQERTRYLQGPHCLFGCALCCGISQSVVQFWCSEQWILGKFFCQLNGCQETSNFFFIFNFFSSRG